MGHPYKKASGITKKDWVENIQESLMHLGTSRREVKEDRTIVDRDSGGGLLTGQYLGLHLRMMSRW